MRNTEKEADIPWEDLEITARNLIYHLAKRYPRSFQWAANEQAISITTDPMDAVATFAMWSDANVNCKQAKIIARHLRIWFGKQLVCGETKLKQTLNNSGNIVLPKTSTYKYGSNETVDWSVRDPVRVLLFFLDGIYNHQSTRKNWTKVDVVVSCDHGKGFSRVHAVIICRNYNDDNRTWLEYTDSFHLAEAKCKKDNYNILKNTFMPEIDSGLKTIVASGGFDVWKKNRHATDDNEMNSDGPNNNQDANDKDDDERHYYMCLSGSLP